MIRITVSIIIPLLKNEHYFLTNPPKYSLLFLPVVAIEPATSKWFSHNNYPIKRLILCEFRPSLKNNIHLVWPDIIYQWKQLGRPNKKLAWMTNHLTFLSIYRDFKQVSSGLTLELTVNARRAQRIAKWAGY